MGCGNKNCGVKLSQLVDEFNLEPIYLPKSAEEIFISTFEVNRPGLYLAGYFKHFQPSRIQIIGNLESSYLGDVDSKLRINKLLKLCEQRVPVIVVAGGNFVFNELIEAAKKYEIPLVKTGSKTSSLISSLIGYLNVELGPKIGIHGVFVEVYGEGVLIVGESGVGKSETAMELMKRGHRLVADDEVEIKRISDRTLVGCSPKNIQHFMELRGIGIVNAKKIFGDCVVKNEEKVDMVISLEQRDFEKNYDRTGSEMQHETILGIGLPKYCIPIEPGRNLALIIEVAAISNMQRKKGYSALKDLSSRLGFFSGF